MDTTNVNVNTEEVVTPQDEVIDIIEEVEVQDTTQAEEVQEESLQEQQTEEVQIDENTSHEQSVNKSNPANSKFAELRRASEAKKKVDKMFSEMAKNAGYDGITTAEEYADAIKRESVKLEQQKALKRYEETKDPKHLLEAQAIQTQDLIKSMQQPVQTPVVEVQAEDILKGEIEAYNNEFGGELKSMDDIATLPNSDKIFDFMQKGLTLSQSHLLANRETIEANNTKVLRQKAINSAKGLNHVKSNGTGGNIDTVQVTRADINWYRKWFPDDSEQQLAKRVRDDKKNGDY